MDNEEAEIQVNEKRPFNTGLSLGGLGGALGGLGGLGGALGGALGGQAGAAGAGALGALGGLAGGLGLGGAVNIVREDVGLTLKLKPQINDEQWVRMEIDQELSDVAGQDQATGVTITAKRAAKTVVVVRDQDSVVIGGLVRDRDSVDESKIPFLGDLPILGALFRRQQKKQEKTNLILIMTPYIIRGPSDFYKVYKRKMDERKEFVERYSEDPRELREHIDWDRKIGPLAYYLQELREEKLRAENGGPGTDGDTVVTPDTLPEGDGEKGEDGVIPLSSGSAPPQAAPPMPDIPAPQPQINP
jgi:general secretion pathway protein D